MGSALDAAAAATWIFRGDETPRRYSSVECHGKTVRLRTCVYRDVCVQPKPGLKSRVTFYRRRGAAAPDRSAYLRPSGNPRLVGPGFALVFERTIFTSPTPQDNRRPRRGRCAGAAGGGGAVGGGSRRDAAAAARIFRGRDVATWIFRGRVAATPTCRSRVSAPRPRRGYSESGTRRRCGRDADIPWTGRRDDYIHGERAPRASAVDRRRRYGVRLRNVNAQHYKGDYSDAADHGEELRGAWVPDAADGPRPAAAVEVATAVHYDFAFPAIWGHVLVDDLLAAYGTVAAAVGPFARARGRRVAATSLMNRGAAAVASRLFCGDEVAATPRPRRGYSAGTRSRPRRGYSLRRATPRR